LRQNFPELIKPHFYSGLPSFSCSAFLYCRANTKDTFGFLFSRISYGAQELAVFLLENSPFVKKKFQ
jgi:hypothetical protein